MTKALRGCLHLQHFTFVCTIIRFWSAGATLPPSLGAATLRRPSTAAMLRAPKAQAWLARSKACCLSIHAKEIGSKRHYPFALFPLLKREGCLSSGVPPAVASLFAARR